MASCTSQASLKTWTRPQSSKTRHLTHWEITHHSTCSITEAEFSSALQNKSHPLQTPRPCPPIPCGYASWKTFIKTGLQWAALPVILCFFWWIYLLAPQLEGRENPHLFLSSCICEYAVQTCISCGYYFVNGLCQLLFPADMSVNTCYCFGVLSL